MKKFYFLLLLAFVIVNPSMKAQIVFNNPSQVYTQDFDGLANSGTNNNFELTGWSSNRLVYNAGTGSANTGAMYSFGEASTTERALGALTSQTTPLVVFGFELQNSTEGAINEISISYTGEQWRRGTRRIFESNVPVPDTLYFEYSLDADSISDDAATWTRLSVLSFISLDTTGADVAKDGNDSDLQSDINGVVTANVPSGQSIWLRWISPRYSNATPGGIVGSKDGLAIDDLSIRLQTTTGIQDVISGPAFGIYPNPVKNNAVRLLFADNIAGVGEFTLYALDGRSLMSTRTALSNNMQLDLPTLPAGVYTLMLHHEGQYQVSKVMIAE